MTERRRPNHRGPHLARTSSAARARGFTILELLIVLALLTLAASVGIPAYFARPSVTLDHAARLLADDLAEVQNRAALYRLPLHVEFDADGGGYRGVHDDGEPLHSPYCDGPYVRRYASDAVFRGVTVSAIDAPDRRLTFDPTGLARTAGTIELSFEGDAREVRVLAGSGLVEVSASAGGADPGH